MPSLFSRSSTPKKQLPFPLDSDEFGRLSPTDPKKHTPADVPPPVPDGSFLPLNLRPQRSPSFPDHDYGYLAYQRHVVLGLEQVSRLVIVVSDELGTRGGITTPFIFSTTALDISSSAIKRLIQAFLATCTGQSGQTAADAEACWRDEARFAGPHELGMCLRWGLARAIRSVGGQDVRGLLSWDRYVEFRRSETAQGYPPAHFATLLHDLNPTLQTVLITLLTLLSRLTANSTSSGHTPPTLSPLFGPLIFGLGPATLAFHHTYTHYLRAVNAMEHLQLVFIRWQDATSTASLGVPVRLKEWIKGYPATLPFLQDPASASNKKPQPRRGVRTVRVMSVRRNVRMYSPDLVKTAASWAYRSDSSGPTKNGLLVAKEWTRIAPPTLKLPPRYSDAYRKRMDMPANFHPETGSLSAPGLNTASSSSSYGSSLTASTNTTDNDYFGNTRTGDDRFRSLTDLKWGEFESMGFSGLEDDKKLQFDLTESARTERSAKRESLNWTDFSSTGFTRSDAPLSATLQFSTPVATTISSWPAHNAEIAKKLKKTEKALPPFGWDTEPVVVNEEIIEEPFIDVFCDLVYGGGWMDSERSEELDRDCNWALVEFKSLPVNRSTVSGGSDPRTSTSLILFEEFVPLEYRQQLAVTPSTRRRRRLPSIFSSGSKSKGWKQAATLNGRPYVVGHVPHSPSYREVEFEEILRGGGGTKVISLGSRSSVKVPPPSRASIPPEVPLLPKNVGALSLPSTPATRTTSTTPSTPVNKPTISGPLYAPAPAPAPVPVSTPENHPAPPKSDEAHSDSSKSKSPSVSSAKRPSSSRFRLPGGIPALPSPGGMRKTKTGGGVMMKMTSRDEYSTSTVDFDFETRLAGWSDDDDGGDDERGGRVRRREEMKDDAWVDILVGERSGRLVGQEAEMKMKCREDQDPDPDVASREVERVLADVRDRTRTQTQPQTPSIASERVDRDPDGGLDHLHGVDRDDDGELRTSEESEYTNTNEHEVDEPEMEDVGLIQQSPTPARILAKNQRRMGYFDVHPERRPVGNVKVDTFQEDVKLPYDTDCDEDDKPFATQLPLRKLPVPPAPAPPVIKIEPFTVEPQKPGVHKQPASPSGNGNGQPAAAAPISKTAALIEMYRERERATSPKPAPGTMPVLMSAPNPIMPLQSTRLPVRSSSLPKDGVVAAPVPLVAPVPKVATPTKLSPGPVLVEPPRIVIEETGRASPGRYVHGAPLHNVLEEEEEE